MMNPSIPNRPFWSRLQERLAASRFLTFSLLIHAIIVILGSSVVIMRSMDPAPDFPTIEVPRQEEATQQLVEEDQPSTEFTPLPRPQPVTPASTREMIPTMLMVNNPALHMPALATISPAHSPMDDKLDSPKLTKGAFSMPEEFKGRTKEWRDAMRKKNTGSAPAEQAVLAGLRWLKEHQNEDGSWSDEHRAAMTGFAVLCFLGHGELPQTPEFGPTVKRGLDWLLAQGTEFQGRLSLTREGWGGNSGVYEHAIATYAMAEYYSMTHDERFAELLREAVAFIVQGQAPDGGWQYAYAKGPDSDTSVSGWQIQALKAAYLTRLGLPGVEDALDKALRNLRRVQGEDGSYGYRRAGDRDYSLDGAGVLCTYFWTGTKDKNVREGIQHLIRQTDNKHPVKYKDDNADLYAWYYNTQACLMMGDPAWGKWNRLFQGELVAAQSPDGSWPPCGGRSPGGELQRRADGAGPCYRTALCVLMLEVYYRTMPVTKG